MVSSNKMSFATHCMVSNAEDSISSHTSNDQYFSNSGMIDFPNEYKPAYQTKGENSFDLNIPNSKDPITITTKVTKVNGKSKPTRAKVQESDVMDIAQKIAMSVLTQQKPTNKKVTAAMLPASSIKEPKRDLTKGVASTLPAEKQSLKTPLKTHQHVTEALQDHKNHIETVIHESLANHKQHIEALYKQRANVKTAESVSAAKTKSFSVEKPAAVSKPVAVSRPTVVPEITPRATNNRTAKRAAKRAAARLNKSATPQTTLAPSTVSTKSSSNSKTPKNDFVSQKQLIDMLCKLHN